MLFRSAESRRQFGSSLAIAIRNHHAGYRTMSYEILDTNFSHSARAVDENLHEPKLIAASL